MNTFNQIQKHKKAIARNEKELAETKLKKRRADTRRKIELGGLVIKAGLDGLSKSTLLGSLDFVQNLLIEEPEYLEIFTQKGISFWVKITPSK